jgi:hypothetical protein
VPLCRVCRARQTERAHALLDLKWMHLSGVLKDGVTSYEVYVEKVREEICRHQGCPLAIEDQVRWRTLESFFASLSVNIEPADVGRVRRLRHLLTHRRGELRTDKHRRQFPTSGGHFLNGSVELTEESVTEALDVLARNVRVIDSHAYARAWGRGRDDSFKELCLPRADQQSTGTIPA